MTPLAPASHLDHLLHQSRMHHMQRSAMADVKANIMLTLAAVVTTFSIGYLSDPLRASGIPKFSARVGKCGFGAGCG